MLWRRRRWFDTRPAGGSFSAQSFAPDGYAEHADHAALSVGAGRSILIGFWAQITSRAASQSFVSKYDTAAGPANEEYNAFYSSGADRYAFQIGNAGGTNVTVQWSAQPPLNTWQFVVCYLNLAAAEAEVLGIRVNNAAPVVSPFGSPTEAISDGNTVFRLGRTADNAMQLTGRMDNPALYIGAAIPFGTIESVLYNAGNGVQYAALSAGEKASMAGFWQLDETSGNFLDSHTNALHLTRNGTFTPFAAKVT